MNLAADIDIVFVTEDPQSRQIREVQPQHKPASWKQLVYLLTLWLHPNPKRTVKLSYIADKSFMFLCVDEMEHLPKPANTAYAIINDNGDHTWTASNGSLERKPYTHIPDEILVKCWHPKGMPVKGWQQMKIFQSQIHFLLKIPYIPWLNPKGHKQHCSLQF